MTHRKLTAAGVLASVTLFASVALAQPHTHGSRAEFDRLVRSATTHYEAHESDAAIQDLERAYAMRPVARLLYNLGRAHEQASHFDVAVNYYNRFLASNPDAQSAQVAREAQTIAQRRVDEAAAEARRVEAEREAREAREAEARRVAELRRLELERRGSSPHPRAPRRVTAPVAVLWTATGLGVAAGAVLGGLALSNQSAFRNTRQGADRADLSDRGSAFALGADLSFGTAVLTGVVGLIVYLAQPRAEIVAP